MKVELQSASPDGLHLIFKDSFFFLTWEDAFEFIKKVEQIENEIDHKNREENKKILKEMMEKTE